MLTRPGLAKVQPADALENGKKVFVLILRAQDFPTSQTLSTSSSSFEASFDKKDKIVAIEHQIYIRLHV
jgi:hypothetical protein